MQGVGDGKEFRFWEPYSPSYMVGVDRFPEPLELTVPRRSASFTASDVTTLPFPDAVFDGVASINTWEHLTDLELALSETRRVVKSGGWFLATFGPLYTAIGGDHLSRIRGGLEHAYNHLLLAREEYADFIEHMTLAGIDVIDGHPRGGRLYVELDLFSHAGWREYHRVFSQSLELELFTVHVDLEAIEFRRRFPDKWAAILDMGHAEEDLLASSITALGRFKASLPGEEVQPEVG